MQERTSGTIVRLSHLRRTTSYADEEYIVGFEDDIGLLEKQLLEGEPRRSVISILGMGGLGKTTLAKKLYKNSVKNANTVFKWHAWVCVSQEWRTRDLFERIIHSFKKLTNVELEGIDKMNDDRVERYLHEILQGKMYLVVIDDVWHREAWESLKRAFPDNKNGSRIIITTRIEAVAEVFDERTYVHKLRLLKPDQSWKLFCKKAFPDHDGICPGDMKELGAEMVEKCNGLPLAIIVLGGLLARKEPHEWVAVKEHIWRELKNNSIHVSSMLALSFKDLPHELKPCFLYLGLFPEDFMFSAEKLIQLFIAEGFIPQGEEGQNLEDTGETYLKELLGRSLIQVAQRNWRSRIATFRVHDLLRDLAVNKAREVKFLQFYDGSTSSSCSSTTSSYRRLAIHSGFESYSSLDHLTPHVRTLFLFNFNHRERLTVLCTSYSLLRVLNLEGVKFNSGENMGLPDVIGKLIHLRYLGLKDTDIEKLPKFIGELQALQIIDASGGSFPRMSLPREICKLKQLRHLIGNFRAPPVLSEELTNLQSLNFVHIGDHLRQEGGERGMLALDFFSKVRNLKFLSVKSSTKIASIQPLFRCRHLLKLILDGIINNLPEDMHKCLPNLQYLELRNSCFKTDPMPILGKIPNLIVLYLDYNGPGYALYIAKGFPQLQILSVNASVRVKVQDDKVDMPRLRAIRISEYGRSFLPDRFGSLPALDDLNWNWEWQGILE